MGATSVTIAVSIDLSLEMPVSVTATSNATNVEDLSGALTTASMTSQSAQVTLTVNAEASAGGTSQSVTQTLTKSFSTPLGTSSEIVFDTFSIPALDFGLGQVTIDLTPTLSLNGYASGDFTVSGPCTLDKAVVQYAESGSQETFLATINEEKDVQIFLQLRRL